MNMYTIYVFFVINYILYVDVAYNAASNENRIVMNTFLKSLNYNRKVEGNYG